jgi:hypothetical protein
MIVFSALGRLSLPKSSNVKRSTRNSASPVIWTNLSTPRTCSSTGLPSTRARIAANCSSVDLPMPGVPYKARNGVLLSHSRSTASPSARRNTTSCHWAPPIARWMPVTSNFSQAFHSLSGRLRRSRTSGLNANDTT